MRKIRRNIMRNKVGNKGMKSEWERYQQKKYGEDYLAICIYIHK